MGMPSPEIRNLLFARGLNISVRDQDLVVCPASGLSPQTRAQLRENKVEIVRYLGQRPGRQGDPLVEFDLDDRSIFVQKFDTSVPSDLGGIIGFDCETEYLEDLGVKIPRLALVAISDGHRHLCVRPDDLADFIRQHPDRHFVFHNAAFDFWVVHEHLKQTGCSGELDMWIELACQRHFHDTMQLDRLIRIAEGEQSKFLKSRDLAAVASDYAGLSISKDDPYRKRFGELIGKPWVGIEPGFFEYAAKDPIATLESFVAMHEKSIGLMKQCGFLENPDGQILIRPDAAERFGPLTETIQANAAIAFAQISRNGLTPDRAQVRRRSKQIKRKIKKHIEWIDENYPRIFKRDKNGKLIRTKQRRQPSVNENELRSQLSNSFDVLDDKQQLIAAVAPQSLKREDWAPYLDKIELADKWFGYQKLCKQLDVLSKFDVSSIHAKYETLKITGRSGCSSPNMQNVPRDNQFRELVKPSDGYYLLTVDYNFIELVTLAETLLGRFGKSKLAEVIKQGIDPHCYTGSMTLKMAYEDFLKLKEADNAKYDLGRNRAKPINFGVPAGMAPKSIVENAIQKYKTEMNLDEATVLSKQLTQQIYPEISDYLIDQLMVTLAANLQVPVETAWRQFDFTGERPGWLPKHIRRIVSGLNTKWNGDSFRPKFLNGIWNGLNQINQNPSFRKLLAMRTGSEELARQLFFERVATLTGRVRGDVRYTTARNTPFQGLAADGAKIALSNLILSGFRVVGFIHDEILIELRDEGGYVSREIVQQVIDIIKMSMEEVTPNVPVGCKATLSTCWSKRAEWIEDGDRILPWSPGSRPTEIHQP